MSNASRALLVGMLVAIANSCASDTASRDEVTRPPRVAIVSGAQAVKTLTTAIYRGGFEAKTTIYETLVKRDDAGRITPGLATSWEYSDGGRALRLVLRPGARFHDGSLVDARAVRIHMRRWIGLPEHDWLLASRSIRSVEEDGPNAVILRIDLPCDVLPDLCAINPTGVTAPATLDHEGAFASPIGSGSWAFDSVREEGRVIRVVRWDERENRRDASRVIDLVRYERPDCRTLVEDLRAGSIDALVEGSYLKIPRDVVGELERDLALRFVEGPGSTTVYLSFRVDVGPCSEREVRRAVSAAIDRRALIEIAENGRADPSANWAPPGCVGWNAKAMSSPIAPRVAPGTTLRFLARADPDVGDQRPLARAIAAQLERAGLAVVVVEVLGAAFDEAVRGGDFDVRIETTWGMPYDPDLALRHRFLDPLSYPSASTPPIHGRTPRAAELVASLARATDPTEQALARAAVEEHLADEALVIPLYVPRRIAVTRCGVGSTPLDRDLYRIDMTQLTTSASARSIP